MDKIYTYIDPSWKPFFDEISNYILECIRDNPNVNWEMILRCFKETPLNNVKVILFNVYNHSNIDDNDGLAFSCTTKIMPSTHNIFRELQKTYPEFMFPVIGNLSNWAKQGVLLLNLQWKINGIFIISWDVWLDKIMKYLNSHIIFLLWGRKCMDLSENIREFASLYGKKIKILEAGHPSPIARGPFQFLGCGHFELTNEKLKKWNKEQIDWTNLENKNKIL